MANVVPSDTLTARVKEAIARSGADAVARSCGVSRESIIRIAAGMPVRTATETVVKQTLRIR